MSDMPWQKPPLSEWSIVGMNHYHVNGERFLFVSMQKDGQCITEEGRDDKYLWKRLCHKAIKVLEYDFDPTQADLRYSEGYTAGLKASNEKAHKARYQEHKQTKRETIEACLEAVRRKASPISDPDGGWLTIEEAEEAIKGVGNE